MPEKTIRIKDIARMAGVSIGTVDRVLHKRGKTSQEATSKVLSVLQKMEYKPNFIARNLGSNRELRIATLVPHAPSDEYWIQCEKGLQDAANDWGHFNLTIEPYLFELDNSASFTKAAHAVLKAKPDGVLMAPLFHTEALAIVKFFTDEAIPFVTINTEITECNGISFIGQNAFQSGRLAAELLYLRNLPGEEPASYAILHINEDIDNAIHLIEKERGFREFFKEAGKTSVVTLSIIDVTGAEFAESLDELLGMRSLRGIFVSTSKAFEVANRMIDKRKVSLVGYDLLSKNLDYLKKGLIDFLIHQNPRRQASQGVNTLSNYLVFRKEAKQRDLFPLEVITRENLQSYLGSDL
ncbi:MAG: substrate-binding domain-containing protein [Bacteroidota bacterium]